MARKLHAASHAVHRPEWSASGAGPHDEGAYNDAPQASAFHCSNGSWRSDYGSFFLRWYADTLISHGAVVLQEAKEAFRTVPGVQLSIKVG